MTCNTSRYISTMGVSTRDKEMQIAMTTYTRINCPYLVVTTGAAIVTAALTVDDACSGAGSTSLEFRCVEVNHLRRGGDDSASSELGCEKDEEILVEHFDWKYRLFSGCNSEWDQE